MTRSVRLLASIAFVTGGAYLAAWLGGAAGTWSAAGVITMKTNMAVALLLAGFALGLLGRDRVGAPARWAGAVVAAAVMAIGLLTLVELLLRVDLGIEQLIATEPPGAAATVSPNRIGPPGSVSLVLLGAGLLALAWKRRYAVHLGVATWLIVLVPAVGLLYGLDPFYGTAYLTGIAWPTVLALCCLATGLVLAARSGGGNVLWRDDPGGVLLRRVLIPTVLIPLVLGYLKVQGVRLGIFDNATGTGLFALILVLLFAALLWRSAVQLSAEAAARKQAAQALAEREERLAVTLRSIGEGVIATDESGRVTVLNSVAEQLTGWNAGAATGRPLEEVFRIVDGETRQPAINPVERLLRQGEGIGRGGHTVLVARDGTERPIADSAAPIREGKRVRGVVLVFRDQTEERRAGQALRDSQERLRGAMQRLESLLENSPLAVLEWSAPDFQIARWSDGATRVFGWTAAETVGKRIDALDWVPRDDWPLVREVMADMTSGKRPRNVSKNRNLRKDGTVIHCEWYNSTVTDGQGKLTGILSLVLDVTERVRNEAAVREADRRKSEFLGVLSHELRNPLAPIQNSIHLLDRAPPGSDQAARAKEVIRRQTTHLTRLVDDLLDLTRISRGKIELQRRRLDLAAVVRRTCDDHRGVFDARGLGLRIESPHAVWVDCDETRVAQMVGNLLQNAAKFSDRGGAVTVRAVADGGEAEIRVRDEGIGMTPDLMRNLFEPFVQAEGSLARTRGGLGLGLAFVKTLAGLHGGSVRAISDGPDRGSEFVVRLPLASAEPEWTPPPADEHGRPLEVIVIEDNVDAAETLADVLRTHGHHVRVATGGRTGIALAQQHKPDVILCDIGLPDLDGYEVARALRRNGLSGVRLIALTGYAQSHDAERADEAGFDAHLAKPPPLETLLGMLGDSAPA
jgi:PAS domain S-box-containing protein